MRENQNADELRHRRRADQGGEGRLIAEFRRERLATDRELNQAHAGIILTERGERVLAEFPADLQRNAAASLDRLGVEIHSGTCARAIEEGLMHLVGGVSMGVATATAAGTAATLVADWLGVKLKHGDRWR